MLSCSTCSCAARSRRALCSAASAAALCWLSSWRARLLALASRQARCSLESASESLCAASEALEESRWDFNWYTCNNFEQILHQHVGMLSMSAALSGAEVMRLTPASWVWHAEVMKHHAHNAGASDLSVLEESSNRCKCNISVAHWFVPQCSLTAHTLQKPAA